LLAVIYQPLARGEEYRQAPHRVPATSSKKSTEPSMQQLGKVRLYNPKESTKPSMKQPKSESVSFPVARTDLLHQAASLHASRPARNHKPICRYGKNCYRKNPNHFKRFSHPWLERQSPQADANGRPICKYGKECNRKNPSHFKEFAHPWIDSQSPPTDSDGRPICRYGKKCYRKDPSNSKEFAHP